MEDNSGIRVKFISDLLHFRLLIGYSRGRILTKKTKQCSATRQQKKILQVFCSLVISFMY